MLKSTVIRLPHASTGFLLDLFFNLRWWRYFSPQHHFLQMTVLFIFTTVRICYLTYIRTESLKQTMAYCFLNEKLGCINNAIKHYHQNRFPLLTELQSSPSALPDMTNWHKLKLRIKKHFNLRLSGSLTLPMN
jgi:hypothetical protein